MNNTHLEIDQLEGDLLLELMASHITRLEQKLDSLQRSKELHTARQDSDTVARIEGQQKRYNQLLEQATQLDRKLFITVIPSILRSVSSSHTGSELMEALELHNQKS